MARLPGDFVNFEEIKRLMGDRSLTNKALARDAALSTKTIERALAGMPIDRTSIPKIAGALKVDTGRIRVDLRRAPVIGKSEALQESEVIRLDRVTSLDSISSTIWTTSDPEGLWLPKLKADVDVSDLSPTRTEAIASTVDAATTLITRLPAATRIRKLGTLNMLLKDLVRLKVSVFVGQYRFRKGAWPFIDPAGEEVGKAVVIDYAYFLFADARQEKYVHRNVCPGMSSKHLIQEVDDITELIKEEAAGSLGEGDRAFLAKLRQESKELFIDWNSRWGLPEDTE